MPTELDISFVEVRDENVEQLKVLNRAIFPINYQVMRGFVCSTALVGLLAATHFPWRVRMHRIAFTKTYSLRDRSPS